MVGVVQDVVGYLCWVRTLKGGVTWEKLNKEIHDGKVIIRPAVKDLEGKLIGHKYPLTQQEWDLPIEQLLEKFPCPEQTQS